ncbi:SDR family NAD(P)-dependent oxidoreductase [Arthrobacter sp. MW3 TE3886]|uniref:SDR family NAD(P)-dependent oxidoreductase n=1 Tax=Arthrobacter sp. MW3 TE3886 TaxID=3156254 RepID=UPI0035162D1A
MSSQQDEFSGRTVVVTGASGGIGSVIAQAFRELTADVLLIDADPRVQETAECMGARWMVGDLRQPEVAREAINTAAEESGRLDVLVNAAGVQLRKDAIDVDEDEWQRLLDINLSAVYRLMRAAADPLSRVQGSIINITSMAAERVLPRIVPYGATKAALVQLSRGLAVELGPQGVRVNAVAPGYITTPMTQDNLAKPEVLGPIMTRLPLQRLGTPADVAEVVLFLASDAARYVTGAVVPVDGGYSLT